MPPHRVLSLALLVPLVLAGCSRTPTTAVPAPEDSTPAPAPKPPTPGPDKGSKPPARPPDQQTAAIENPRVAKNREAGVLSGFVRWTGPEPAIPPEQTLKVGGRVLTVRPVPRLRVDSASHGIADVAVWLAGSGEGESAPSIEPVRLTQEHGNYSPHVLLAQKGQTLELRTADPRADFNASGAATFSTPLERGAVRSYPLSHTGAIEIRSQLHPWMTPAHVLVLEHARHALTGSDGKFRLPPVSAGEHEIVLWHEGWQPGASHPIEVRVRVKLTDGEGAAVEWSLPGP
jgi:hypothetical protein